MRADKKRIKDVTEEEISVGQDKEKNFASGALLTRAGS